MTVRRVRVRVEVEDDTAVLSLASAATRPENDLAPEGMLVRQTVDRTLVFECVADMEANPRLTVSSVRRTVDDFIFSLIVAVRTIEHLRELK